MKRKLATALGRISVIVFSLLLGLTIFGCMQGDDNRPEQEAPAAALEEQKLPQADNSELPGTVGNNIVMGNTIEDASIDCSGGAPRLSLTAIGYSPLPADTVLLSSPVIPGGPEGRRSYANPTGELEPTEITVTATREGLERVPLDGNSPQPVLISTVQVMLPQSISVSEYEDFQVLLLAPDATSDVQLQSNTLFLDMRAVRC